MNAFPLLAALSLAAPAAPASAEAAAPSTAPLRTVFVMHGILDTRWKTLTLERALRKAGYKVVNLSYPSRDKTVEEHADWLAGIVRERGEGELYFVGHSLGSIVIRLYLARERPAAARRFVMIAPPNHGSVGADVVNRTPLFPLVWGRKAGDQMRSSRKDFWESLPPPPVEFGIIAGGRSNERGFNPLIPGDDDGAVSVEEARLEGAKEFVVLPYGHTTIMLRRKVVQKMLRFLAAGSFE